MTWERTRLACGLTEKTNCERSSDRVKSAGALQNSQDWHIPPPQDAEVRVGKTSLDSSLRSSVTSAAGLSLPMILGLIQVNTVICYRSPQYMPLNPDQFFTSRSPCGLEGSGS